jgi:heptosyltransferase-3
LRRDPPRRVLIICLRRLGDVLLTTPLVRSLRRAWPDCRIDILVYAASASVLEGNPDIDRVLVEPRSSGAWARGRLALGLLRRYDLSISTLYSDRPHIYALLASSQRVNVVPPFNEPGAALKRRLSAGWSMLALGENHAVDEYLRLADVLGVARASEVVPPRTTTTAAIDALLGPTWREQRIAVVHPLPMYRYKEWTDVGWRVAIEYLVQQHGLRVVVSGGPVDAERSRVAGLVSALPAATASSVVDAAGRLSFAELAEVLRVASVFLGPDTSVTHLAAACGVPTVALFGPSHPVAWGPWPQQLEHPERGSPWQLKSPLQREGNVWLVQGEGDCVPCLQEGCERHQGSRSACLDDLPFERVRGVLDEALAGRRSARLTTHMLTPVR